ncbi:M16 family metallopeptidase [Marinifilum caeruleilacunae]|uniref:Insulinase family protein n=1 Tax=Marinifilum caeruleilacunae TaxID=2499076 RepID=A0ABX1WTW9_9BACT|nr:pitrilysin family protein [Marinifilum caeruleilacunae]NOU59374.1 insulinase family protein [Marinifilum caeruleilacunae]
MEKLYRNTAPKFKTVDSIEILGDTKYTLSNNIPVHVINGGSQEVLKIEFIFDAGIWYQESPLVASMANSMLNEGTSRYKAAEIAEKFDFYGAYIGFSAAKHDASVCLYTLNKYLPETLEITENLIKESTFPQKEFDTILLNKKQRFQIEHQKTNVLAKDEFSALMYGKKHPYSNIFDESEFDKLDIKTVKEFYKSHYTANNCKIIIAGKVDQSVIDQLEKMFGAEAWPQKNEITKVKHEILLSDENKAFVCKEDAVQACIRIGRPIFNKTHKDYTTLHLFNLILGGYFGSRLMQNIREDKGYTYGINSIIISHLKGGHFVIVTEVGSDVCKDAISEIYKEIKKLRDELISDEELNLVKNYISGEMLRNLDSPFALSESLKGNLAFGLDNSYYQSFIKELKTIDAEKIKALANTYFQEQDLKLVVCGPEECRNSI